MSTPIVTPAQWIDTLKWRYAVKRFDASRKIAPETWAAIEQSLVLTPSSFGLQPWQFIVVKSPEMQSRLPAISWNQTQPGDCSHMVVLAARRTVDADYVDDYIKQMSAARNVPVDSLAGLRQVIVGFLESSTLQHLNWSTNQVYIALGQLMATAAALGVDACPMEGIVGAQYDELLGLADSPYTTRVGCALGYRHAEDKYAGLAKVRHDSTRVVRYA